MINPVNAKVIATSSYFELFLLSTIRICDCFSFVRAQSKKRLTPKNTSKLEFWSMIKKNYLQTKHNRLIFEYNISWITLLCYNVKMFLKSLKSTFWLSLLFTWLLPTSKGFNSLSEQRALLDVTPKITNETRTSL